MSDVMRRVYDSLWPQGPVWKPKKGGYLDRLLDGIASADNEVRNSTAALADVRNPERTALLQDLEAEYGIRPRAGSAESERRQYLRAVKYSDNHGSSSDLRDALAAAGFSVNVFQNDPVADPRTAMTVHSNMYCGDENAYCGDANAVCGYYGGVLYVNGLTSSNTPVYEMTCGNENAYCGDANAVCGYYIITARSVYEYSVPDDPDCWPFVFFVCHDVIRDPVSGRIETMIAAGIPVDREYEFKKIILRHKPLFSWAAISISLI